jgi:hypothetical protein
MRGGVLAGVVAVFLAVPANCENEGGCRIRTAAVDEAGIATIEAHCKWDVPPAWLLTILRDPAQLGAALSTLSECRAVPGRRVEVHSVGWPLADRQVTVDWSEQALADGGTRFSYARSRRQEPLAEGRVQIEIDEGWWEVRSGASGGATLAYSSRYDAGANLEPFIARPFLDEGIAKSLRELREAAERLEASARDVAAAPP